MFLERMSHNFLLEESQNQDPAQTFGGAAQVDGTMKLKELQV